MTEHSRSAVFLSCMTLAALGVCVWLAFVGLMNQSHGVAEGIASMLAFAPQTKPGMMTLIDTGFTNVGQDMEFGTRLAGTTLLLGAVPSAVVGIVIRRRSASRRVAFARTCLARLGLVFQLTTLAWTVLLCLLLLIAFMSDIQSVSSFEAMVAAALIGITAVGLLGVRSWRTLDAQHGQTHRLTD